MDYFCMEKSNWHLYNNSFGVSYREKTSWEISFKIFLFPVLQWKTKSNTKFSVDLYWNPFPQSLIWNVNIFFMPSQAC